MERQPKKGQVVVTLPGENTDGFSVANRHISVRKPGIGKVLITCLDMAEMSGL